MAKCQFSGPAGSILAHGKAGCGTVGMDTVSCKGVDPWGGLYEHSHFGNPQGTPELWDWDQVCTRGKIPETGRV